jgi:hypothetical protein
MERSIAGRRRVDASLAGIHGIRKREKRRKHLDAADGDLDGRR